jgi:hypothetical protein
MPIFELIAFLCVVCGAGALLGLGFGVLFGAPIWGAVVGQLFSLWWLQVRWRFFSILANPRNPTTTNAEEA